MKSPVAIHFEDYHQIPDFLKRVQKIFPDIRCKEVPFEWIKEDEIEEVPYWGVFWTKGNMPCKEFVVSLVREESEKSERIRL